MFYSGLIAWRKLKIFYYHNHLGDITNPTPLLYRRLLSGQSAKICNSKCDNQDITNLNFKFIYLTIMWQIMQMVLFFNKYSYIFDQNYKIQNSNCRAISQSIMTIDITMLSRTNITNIIVSSILAECRFYSYFHSPNKNFWPFAFLCTNVCTLADAFQLLFVCDFTLIEKRRGNWQRSEEWSTISILYL